MKLLAFRIKNYRSIVDTGWHSLAHDNITSIIGQNESGKTSILEALKCFYSGEITEDVLRSDLTFPEVYCKFDFNYEDFSDKIREEKIPGAISSEIRGLKSIELLRKWNEDRSSIIKVSDPVIAQYYDTREKERGELLKEVDTEITKISNTYGKLSKEIKVTEREKNELEEKISDYNQHNNPLKRIFKGNKRSASNEVVPSHLVIENLKNDFKEATKKHSTLEKEIAKIEDKAKAADICLEAEKRLAKSKEQLDESLKKLRREEQSYAFTTKENRAYQKNILSDIREHYHHAFENFKKDYRYCTLTKLIVSKILKEGVNYTEAEKSAYFDLAQEEKLYSLENMGEVIFERVPEFIFFEDFSSLLPNKIDLDDIVSDNKTIEGYKAARNFLAIAGLDSEFFSEKNNRILKQKIENLNSEITINFQDFWRQNVGKNNKIRLNFELEHYDFTHPDKSGKPYLEFWIKDNKERLYPKQRSRGVRWFLSFYLELKASAMLNHTNKVLLIDEPGLSLHARAQEDVLMVFEDIKDQMQILYCTHSPHLVDVDKMHRILAVQRANQDDYSSETTIYSPKDLYSASADTLSPIYTLMGVKLTDQQFIRAKNNIIVEDLPSFYYLNTLWKIFESNDDMCFLPASNADNIINMANMLTGWRLDYMVILTAGNQKIYDFFKQNYLSDSAEEQQNRFLRVKEFDLIEDIFSAIDFKRYVLNKRVGITEKNSEYIVTNNLSRTMLASNFISLAKENRLQKKDFDEETVEKVESILSKIRPFAN